MEEVGLRRGYAVKLFVACPDLGIGVSQISRADLISGRRCNLCLGIEVRDPGRCDQITKFRHVIVETAA